MHSTMAALYSEHYSIRQFNREDIPVYKATRLEALQLEPGMFGNSYALEAAFDEEAWDKRVTSSNNACFGLYHADSVIGITGIVIDAERPDEAYMTQSYIRKPYRGSGLSRMLYEARLSWARQRGLNRLIIGHRESNIISKAANQRYGFRYTHSQSRLWPDGYLEDMLYYVLEL